jgi:asparagine synthetase A
MPQLTIPAGYRPMLTVKETEQAIIRIKDFFQLTLSTELNLTRVTARSSSSAEGHQRRPERDRAAGAFPVKD